MMTENRPNPIQAADLVRSLIECWLELDQELTRNSGPGSRGRREGAVPLDIDVLDAKRKVDTFAHTYCHMLMDETKWTPAALNTPHLLHGIVNRIGHFTHNDNAQIGWEFHDDLDKVHRAAWAVARPGGKVPIPIGPCFADGCTGILHVTIDRDKPLRDDEVALWRPTAVCHVKDIEGKPEANDAHRIDARLYHADKVAQHAEAT